MKRAGRLLAVGDIHGCLESLEGLIDKVEPDKKDTIVFLGDYINRGPNSYGVIEYLLTLKTKCHTVFLIGNHEKMLLDYLDNGNISFRLNGGDKTLESYKNHNLDQLPSEHINFFRNLLPYFETDEFVFVHAGLRPGIPLINQNITDLIWIRDEFQFSTYDWGKTIVYGHTINRLPVILKNRIGLDTGCVCSESDGYGKLSCCDVVNKVIWSF